MVEFDADFENASLGQVTRIAEDWYQIGLLARYIPGKEVLP